MISLQHKNTFSLLVSCHNVDKTFQPVNQILNARFFQDRLGVVLFFQAGPSFLGDRLKNASAVHPLAECFDF